MVASSVTHFHPTPLSPSTAPNPPLYSRSSRACSYIIKQIPQPKSKAPPRIHSTMYVSDTRCPSLSASQPIPPSLPFPPAEHSLILYCKSRLPHSLPQHHQPSQIQESTLSLAATRQPGHGGGRIQVSRASGWNPRALFSLAHPSSHFTVTIQSAPLARVKICKGHTRQMGDTTIFRSLTKQSANF